MVIALRRFAAALLLTSPLAACDSGIPEGRWVNMYDPEDRIEIASSSETVVTAVLGEQLDFWPSAAPAAKTWPSASAWKVPVPVRNSRRPGAGAR